LKLRTEFHQKIDCIKDKKERLNSLYEPNTTWILTFKAHVGKSSRKVYIFHRAAILEEGLQQPVATITREGKRQPMLTKLQVL
jgi:copper homeostasis protein CutC